MVESKYSDEMVGQILGLIAAGSPLSEACRIAGVSRNTVYDWVRRDPGLRTKLDRAEGQRQSGLRKMLLDLGEEKGDWKAPAWLLERTSPDYRERKELAVHVEHAVGQLLDALSGVMSEEAYGELVDGVARLQGVDESEACAEAGEADYAVAALPAAGRSGSE